MCTRSKGEDAPKKYLRKAKIDYALEQETMVFISLSNIAAKANKISAGVYRGAGQ